MLNYLFDMENYRYELAKKGKAVCPECRQKTFVLYLDRSTGNPVHSTVGKCDRSDNCSHHYTPKQYFADNNISFDTEKNYTPRPKLQPKPQPSFIDTELMKKSLRGYEENRLIQYLGGIVGVEVAMEVAERYRIGMAKGGGTVFWQIDGSGKVRTGKIIQYDTNGRRRKDVTPPVQWVHSALKLPDFHLSQCLFGEHLLRGTTKMIAVVESEKTALIASCYLPDFIWLACGGSEGLNADKLKCLTGRRVVLYPDAGMYDKWSKQAKALSVICNMSVSSLIEQQATDEELKAGFDLADYFVKQPFVKATKIDEDLPESMVQVKPIQRIPDKPKRAEQPKQPKPTNWDKAIDGLCTYFSSISLPTEAVKLDQCTTILNVAQFIDSHLSLVRAQNGKPAFLPYLNRLLTLKQILISNI